MVPYETKVISDFRVLQSALPVILIQKITSNVAAF